MLSNATTGIDVVPLNADLLTLKHFQITSLILFYINLGIVVILNLFFLQMISTISMFIPDSRVLRTQTV